METEKQRGRLVELIKYNTMLSDLSIEEVVDACMKNGVIVPPIMVYPEVNAQVYYEDLKEICVRNKYTYTWEEERKILNAKEMSNGT